MGVAALWVMLFHGTMDVPIKGIEVLVKIGYLGVDIFMFMSGFSMQKSFNKSLGVKDFFLKRIIRIMPTFIPFSFLWCFTYLREIENTKTIAYAARSSEFWITLAVFRWFVPAICICYLITPIIDKILKRFDYKFASLVLMIVVCLILAFPFMLIGSSVALMVLLRIPEYIIGYWYANSEGNRIPIIIRILFLVSLYVVYYYLLGRFSDSYLADTGLYWLPPILCVSSMVICLSRSRIINNPMCKFMGKYSLELYLWHVFLLFPLERVIKNFSINLDKYGVAINLLAIFWACFVAWIYAKTIHFLSQVIFKRAKENKSI